jgi:hypothetical protein
VSQPTALSRALTQILKTIFIFGIGIFSHVLLLFILFFFYKIASGEGLAVCLL